MVFGILEREEQYIVDDLILAVDSDSEYGTVYLLRLIDDNRVVEEFLDGTIEYNPSFRSRG